MAKIQCKMCGGEIQVPEGVCSGSCPYCGTLTTFPKVSSEELENLYNRAEHFRRINEYDKAVSAYEKIVEINPDDAEAYWGLVISKFGIEYVEDPASHERIPTCHRVHYESILADADYLNALEKAGSYEKGIYEAEAKRIAEIQRDILSISNNEQPFDVFICYKESDNYGRRTKDSVTAQEIYYQLTNAGYKVFFARITLESKLGQQYEPYIFAALNSAKVMLVIGSQKEYFDAVWVRNEWSRFLALMKKDRSKLLIPCYKDMDAYDIPDALSMFQAQDMGKIGFIQDLLHGIKKVADKQESASPAAPTATPVANSQQLHPFLRRAKLFLRSGDFESAKEYCEKTLDQEPENGWAYFYRLMAENKLNDENKLFDIDDIQRQKSFTLAQEFADKSLNDVLNWIIITQLEICNLAKEKEQRDKKAHEVDQQLRQESKDRYLILNRQIDLEQQLDNRHDIVATLIQCKNAEKNLLEYTGELTAETVQSIQKASEDIINRLPQVNKRDGDLKRKNKKRKSIVYSITFLIVVSSIFIYCRDLFEQQKEQQHYRQQIYQWAISPQLPPTTTVQNNNVCLLSANGKIVIGTTDKNITSCIIPHGVTTIGNNAFCDCSDLTSVTLPDSITVIEYCAFWNCSSLISITIPDSVTSIGNWAFSGCSSLISITIPDSVTFIGEKAFLGCSSLTSVTIPWNCAVANDAFPSSCRVIRR